MPIIDHIGIALSDFAELGRVLESLGLVPQQPEEIPEQKVNTWDFRAGSALIELLIPTSPDSPIAKYLEKKGAGIHHIAIRVQDIKAQIAEFKAKGYQMIDENPRKGAGGKLIAFLHPKSTGGILIELVQVKRKIVN